MTRSAAARYPRRPDSRPMNLDKPPTSAPDNARPSSTWARLRKPIIVAAATMIFAACGSQTLNGTATSSPADSSVAASSVEGVCNQMRGANNYNEALGMKVDGVNAGLSGSAIMATCGDALEGLRVTRTYVPTRTTQPPTSESTGKPHVSRIVQVGDPSPSAYFIACSNAGFHVGYGDSTATDRAQVDICLAG